MASGTDFEERRPEKKCTTVVRSTLARRAISSCVMPAARHWLLSGARSRRSRRLFLPLACATVAVLTDGRLPNHSSRVN